MAYVRKWCWRCERQKLLVDFWKDRTRTDGLRTICITCAKETHAAYRVTHREHLRRRGKELEALSPVAYRQRSLKHYRAHRDREKARCDRYRRQHLTRYRELAAKRRALQYQTQTGPVDYRAIRARDGMRCHLCLEPVHEHELHFDHIVPLSRGGAHVESNIAVSHAWCNQSKSARLMSEMA